MSALPSVFNLRVLFVVFSICLCTRMRAQEKKDNSGKLYEFNADAVTRWSSPENKNGQKGAGSIENAGAKGHASESLEPGETKSLLDIEESGVINRIWITVSDRSPEMLRSIRLEMFWDKETKPAVSVPLGDFFGVGLGRTATFQNTCFANPEGKSFNCFIPMPFRKAALIKVTNESGKRLSHIFFDVDYQLIKNWHDDYMYFHACWNRDTATELGKDFNLLPAVHGKGRFLGVNIGINANPAYGDSWWGEGEVKIYLDGDKEHPTLVGTGTEDYIGTGWGQGVFSNNYTGCLIADGKKMQWAYYRFHIPDPVFFGTDCMVSIQQIGGNGKQKVLSLQKAGAPLVPVSIDFGGKLIPLYANRKNLDDAFLPDGWTNFYRSDDVSATAYFYLDRPSDDLLALQPVQIRIYNLKTKE